MNTQRELELEEEFSQQMEMMGWEPLKTNRDGLELNLRTQIESRHDAFKENPLTDAEWGRIRTKIIGLGVYESAKLFQQESVELVRDDGTIEHYTLFNKSDPKANNFQIARQVEAKTKMWNYRYDVTLLVNGLPIIQIELKRRGGKNNDAFEQICKYKRESGYQGIYNFLQFFVTSNGATTLFHVNDDKGLKAEFAFGWTDKDNNQFEDLKDLTPDFFNLEHITKMLSRHVVLNGGDKSLKVMRPYQFFGSEIMARLAVHTDNNGYAFQTTGSGKTLTTLVLARTVAEDKKFRKIVILVDRVDLKEQTNETFQQYEIDFLTFDLDERRSTKSLVRDLQSTHKEKRIIVTTIQRLVAALKSEKHKGDMEKLGAENFLFIVDECHRSQAGIFNRSLRENFSKAQFFGFTGTPLFEQNSTTDGRTTADIFGECQHTYTMREAIADGNVLPLSATYMETIQLKGKVEDGSEKVEGVNKKEILEHPERINAITQDIIKNHARKSSGGKYNAILAVESIDAAIKHKASFDEANTKLPKNKQLITATIFSMDLNGDGIATQSSHRKAHAHHLEDYNKIFRTNFSVKDLSAYNKHVQKNVKNGSIDLVIVVDMLLTGFDSPITNTIYIDKFMELHNLVQAISRVNRVYDAGKTVGHIRFYRNLKEKLDEALTLFSGNGNSNKILCLPFEEQEVLYKKAVKDLLEIAPTPGAVAKMRSERGKLDFAFAFRKLLHELRRVQHFIEFDHDNYDISALNIENYRSHYLHFKHEFSGKKVTASLLGDFDFRLEEVLSDLVNYDYITKLLMDLDVEDEDAVGRIRKMLPSDGEDSSREKYEWIMMFLKDVVPTFPKGTNTLKEWKSYAEKKAEETAEGKSPEFGITKDVFLRILDKYRSEKKFDRELFDNETTLTDIVQMEVWPRLQELVISSSKILDMKD